MYCRMLRYCLYRNI